MRRAILLQTEPTTSKARDLSRFSRNALNLANGLLKAKMSGQLMELHTKNYKTSKRATGFNSQVICDIERTAAKCKGTSLKAITVKCNAPRNCKTFHTKSRMFVELGLCPRRRVAVPIAENENLKRYRKLLGEGWSCKTYGLTSSGQIVAYLSKEDEPRHGGRNMLGVDVNSKSFAITIMAPEGKILLQTYLGKDIWHRRKQIMMRKAHLQSLADQGGHRAQRSLNRLECHEHNYVKNRVDEVVKQIMELAAEYDADVGIEKLERFSPKSRNFNREVLRMPFYAFRQTLEARCFDASVNMFSVDPYHTSKWCSRCGAVAARGHSANYALFKCSKCGLIVNSDRKASLAVAVKSLLARTHCPNQAWVQVAGRQVLVSGLLRSDEDAAQPRGLPAANADGTPATFSRG